VPTLAQRDYDDLWSGIRLMLPVGQRYRGILYDANTQAGAEIYPVEKITVPTILFSSEDDLYQTMRVARKTASRIPGATLVEFQTGGHFLLGHRREVWPRVAEFIRRAQASVASR
jgi:pimeloyl-ACP methyl ester carboxylesterase